MTDETVQGPEKCKNGHLLTEDNVYFRVRKGKRYRYCRRCSVTRSEERRALLRAKKPTKVRAPETDMLPAVDSLNLLDLAEKLETAMPWEKPALLAKVAEIRRRVDQ